jgi:GNAT superfamily N-acetyltransferase
MNGISLKIRAVGPGNFADFARLFEAKGGPSYCWCLAWRKKPETSLEGPLQPRNATRKAAMQDVVDAGVPIGLLAYDGEEPVGWCSVGPRDSFLNLGGPETGTTVVWSLVCFYVPRARRGQGIARLLLRAAIDAARAAGAMVLEAYPVDPDSPSYRFMGFVPFFVEAGFAEVARAGSRRHVMRLELG